MVINQNMSSTDKTIENYIAAAMAIPLVSNATASTTTSVVVPPFVPPQATQSVSTSVVVAPPPPPPVETTTSVAGILPAPTGVAGVTTTSAIAPATFTGAASQQRLDSKGALAGLAVVGLAALL